MTGGSCGLNVSTKIDFGLLKHIKHEKALEKTRHEDVSKVGWKGHSHDSAPILLKSEFCEIKVILVNIKADDEIGIERQKISVGIKLVRDSGSYDCLNKGHSPSLGTTFGRRARCMGSSFYFLLCDLVVTRDQTTARCERIYIIMKE